MFYPKALALADMLKKYNIEPKLLCDCGAGTGLFLDEVSKILPSTKLFAIEPSRSSVNILKSKGFRVNSTVVEKAGNWKNKFDFVTSLEVFEHTQNPLNFILSVSKILKKNGYFLITTLGYEGYDILTLGKQSNSISPPHHLNFLSLNGFKVLLKNADLNLIDIFTPGLLDYDIVVNSEFPTEFANAIKSRGKQAENDFQNFLIKHNLSSHYWILCQK